tara:strand:+ start:10671 stop:10928 length:258 start_codon:yes stop_codon:yes gene_type:complete
MDCGFYLIYFEPSQSIKKKINDFWIEQRRIAFRIRDYSDKEGEIKFYEKYIKPTEYKKGLKKIKSETIIFQPSEYRKDVIHQINM